MRRPWIAAGFFLFCASALPGQSHGPWFAMEPTGNCPVELLAEQAHDGALSQARSSGRTGHAEQVIDLSIRNIRLRRILGAEIAVHGTSPQGRVVALGAAGDVYSVADAVRRVHLDASVPANQQRTHRLSVTELTSVQWIDVIGLHYADGSTWRGEEGRVCRVEPDPILRVASAR